MRAFAQPVPQSWELREEQEELHSQGEVDLLLNEQLQNDLGFEAEQKSFAEELTEMAHFAPDEEDEGRMRNYSLQRVPHCDPWNNTAAVANSGFCACLNNAATAAATPPSGIFKMILHNDKIKTRHMTFTSMIPRSCSIHLLNISEIRNESNSTFISYHLHVCTTTV